VVTADKPGLYVAVYRQPQAALLVVANPGETAQAAVTLSVDLGALFGQSGSQRFAVLDAEYPEYIRLGFKPEQLSREFMMQAGPVAAEVQTAQGKPCLTVKVDVAPRNLRILRVQSAPTR